MSCVAEEIAMPKPINIIVKIFVGPMLHNIREIKIIVCIEIIHDFRCPITLLKYGIFSLSTNGAHKNL